jgi:UDPglucose 6-dehydrogenase/GDP-mannose 6-dehydrogenase
VNVAIVGCGYVGLVTGVCLAAEGHNVHAVDTDRARTDLIARGQAPFYEPGLEELLRTAIGAGHFAVGTDLSAAIRKADVIMLAVGTPSIDGIADLTALESALQSVGSELAASKQIQTVVIKSTVVPTTCDTFALPILERASGKLAGAGFGLAMNPEFLREGHAVEDFRNPDRIVIGALDEPSAVAVENLYETYECPKLRTTLRNAEMIKYASNALLALLISFSNEIAGMCESIAGVDAGIVMDGLHLDRRLSPMVDGRRIEPQILTYLRPGVGFGGSCLPKDVAALLSFARSHGAPAHMLEAVLDVNARRPQRIVEMIRSELGSLHDKRIVLLGLAFKPGTDDLRDSPALRIAGLLLQEGAQVSAVDPFADRFPSTSINQHIRTSTHPEGLLVDADAAVVVTAWPDFRQWDWAALLQSMRAPVLFDGRNALRDVQLPESARYIPIGRASAPLQEGSRIG